MSDTVGTLGSSIGTSMSENPGQWAGLVGKLASQMGAGTGLGKMGMLAQTGAGLYGMSQAPSKMQQYGMQLPQSEYDALKTRASDPEVPTLSDDDWARLRLGPRSATPPASVMDIAKGTAGDLGTSAAAQREATLAKQRALEAVSASAPRMNVTPTGTFGGQNPFAGSLAGSNSAQVIAQILSRQAPGFGGGFGANS